MSDTPELIKGVLVNGQIHKIDYNALANKPSIPIVPDPPSAVTQLDELLIPANNGKYIGIENAQYRAKTIGAIDDYIILGSAHTYDSSISYVRNDKCIFIGDYAFYGCENLSYISLANIRYIGNYAFNGCNSLYSANIYECTKIGANAFMSCSNLNEVNVNYYGSLDIGANAFDGCTNLRTIEMRPTTIGAFAFESCSNLYSSIPTAFFERVTYIGRGAFANAAMDLGTDVAQQNVELYLNAIEPYTFYNFSSPKLAFSLPACVTIGESAFKYARLSMFTAPVCKRIENDAFLGAYIHYLGMGMYFAYDSWFPEVTTIGDQAFESFSMAYNLQRDMIFGKVEKIGSSAFRYNTWISRFYSPECTQIFRYAFSGCSNLLEISIPKVSEINEHTFEGCVKLSTISLPNCTYLGTSTFYNCSSLYSIYLLADTIVRIPDANVFSNTPIMKSEAPYGSIYVPSSLYSQYIVSSYWSDIASRIVSM